LLLGAQHGNTQRPRPQSKAGHNEQGSEAKEEEREGESETKGTKSHQDIDQEKIDSHKTKKTNVNIKKRSFRVEPRVIKTLIKEISCGIVCMQNMYKPPSQTHDKNVLEISLKWRRRKTLFCR